MHFLPFLYIKKVIGLIEKLYYSLLNLINFIIVFLSGYNLVIIDNLSNSKIEKLDTIKGYNKFNSKIFFYSIDLVNWKDLDFVYKDLVNLSESINQINSIDIIIHLAGLKAVGESVSKPLEYYQNNLVSTLNLIKLMELYKIKNLIFSSSSTVYGSASPPYLETTQTGLGITNPYGRSKFIQEEMLKDIQYSHPDWNIVLLRYFNPIGNLGTDLKEDPNGIPNNLFPYLVKVYKGELTELTIFGSDYETRDGTCSRDFVHVVDLANAHKVCSDNLIRNKISGLKIYNVGTGTDTTVLQLIKSFEKVNNCKLNYKFGSRRQGDLESSYSDVKLIAKELGWIAKYSIDDCVKID